MSTERDHHTTATTEASTESVEITSSVDTAELTNESKEESKGESQSEAFDPETGEINWDCPCLGGMAHGTCGEEFKTAFSCFVYSEEEPKGMDCIDAFKAMQDCFRAHPEEYANEIAEEEEEDNDNVSDTETDLGDGETDLGGNDRED
ncbi:Oxidoreductase [Coemansia sp. RSA 1813]|nr:Oxidoreductase [Coemansia sp. RSA 1646]KAJ1770740.1 Oxidoreductase [Coemansia sp. RSA 1843]KAJ2088774.1 Oxidoreductase [Coemansia sp. RSA 986]KAJ2213710.1 Oxidoreductase [Coemansia sp. RSA 487]KAJ2568687.1 Oxidoreductase [Coemansia sp. RSA 1813]